MTDHREQTPEEKKILDDPEAVKLLVRALLRKAERARTNTFDFFEFVMREEFTRRPIKLWPHQKLGIEFVKAHEKSVLLWPIGHSKTFTTAALALEELGENATNRGMIVSASQGQAEKPLRLVADYVRESPELRLVYPRLVPSQRSSDPWTQTAITVDRPPGIRDASLRAVGINGNILGARLSRLYVDDVHDAENVSTKEARDKVYRLFAQDCVGRLDTSGDARVVVTNTARHAEDLPHRLMEKGGWPTLKMAASGDIRIYNTDFDSDLIRPASDSLSDERVRLVAHDPDPDNEQTLCPERLSREAYARIRETTLPEIVANDYEQETSDEETALCKQAYVDRCKEEFHGRGRRQGHAPFVPIVDGRRPFGPEWFCTPEQVYRPGPNTYTGVDLGIGQERRHDETALFTFEYLPGGWRLILDVEIGRWDGDAIVGKIVDKHRRYGSIVRVETNGGQKYVKDFALKHGGIDLPVRAHHTGKEKHDPIVGVFSIFTAMMNGAWLIPCDAFGRVHPAVGRWIAACLSYRPTKHTGDVLMACWFADTQARKLGHGAVPGATREEDPFASAGASLGMSIMAR